MPLDWPYDWQRPWIFVFAEILRPAQAAWIYKELEYPALLLVSSRVTVGDVLGGDAAISGHAPASSPPGLDVHQTAVPDTHGEGAQRRMVNPPPRGGGERPARQPRAPRMHNVVEGVYQTN